MKLIKKVGRMYNLLNPGSLMQSMPLNLAKCHRAEMPTNCNRETEIILNSALNIIRVKSLSPWVNTIEKKKVLENFAGDF